MAGTLRSCSLDFYQYYICIIVIDIYPTCQQDALERNCLLSFLSHFLSSILHADQRHSTVPLPSPSPPVSGFFVFCFNPTEFIVLEGKELNALMKGFLKRLDNFMSNNNICNYTCCCKLKVINSHVAGQSWLLQGPGRSYFLPFMEFLNWSDALRFLLRLFIILWVMWHCLFPKSGFKSPRRQILWLQNRLGFF